MNAYSNGVVTSGDGTSIGYRRMGQGPGMVLVQGAMGPRITTISSREPSQAPSPYIFPTVEAEV